MLRDLQSARLITAIKTPYLSNGAIDFQGFDYLLEQQVRGGADGVLVAGTTGEGHLMNADEILALTSRAVSRVGNQLIVVVNSGGNDTKKATDLTELIFGAGADIALQINPYYGKTSTKGVVQHFQALLEIGPGIIYNVPSRTAQDIEPDTMFRIAEHKNFRGIKECMGSERIGLYTKEGIRCWSGNDDSAYESRHNFGSNGVISVTANVTPGLMAHIMDEADTNIDTQLQPLIKWLFCEPNPVALNTCLAMTGAVKAVFRMPYVPLHLSQRQEGLSILRNFETQDLVGDSLSLMEDRQFFVI